MLQYLTETPSLPLVVPVWGEEQTEGQVRPPPPPPLLAPSPWLLVVNDITLHRFSESLSACHV